MNLDALNELQQQQIKTVAQVEQDLMLARLTLDNAEEEYRRIDQEHVKETQKLRLITQMLVKRARDTIVSK